MTPDPRVDALQRRLGELTTDLATALARITALDAHAPTLVWGTETARPTPDAGCAHRPGAAPPDGAAGPGDNDVAGPTPDTTVWVSVRRRGIPAHRLAGPSNLGSTPTGCGRSTWTGHILTAEEAVDRYDTVWCAQPGCWAAGAAR